MSKFLRYAAVGAAVASLGIASSAQAALSDSANVSATILSTLSVAVDGTANTLDFASIAPGATPATIVVAPDGSMTCPSGVACSGTTAAPTFHITGAPGGVVDVTFANASETLSSGLNTMTVNTFTTNLTGNQVTLDAASGLADFTVGGSLAVAAQQAAGSYTGTLTVDVAYN